MLLRGAEVTPHYTIMVSTFHSKNFIHLSLSVVFAVISDLVHEVRLQFTVFCYCDLTGMPPKGRKSASPWNLCENCKVIVSQKDLAMHIENSCPPLSELWTHGYIKDKVLYGVLEEVNPQGNAAEVIKNKCN